MNAKEVPVFVGTDQLVPVVADAAGAPIAEVSDDVQDPDDEVFAALLVPITDPADDAAEELEFAAVAAARVQKSVAAKEARAAARVTTAPAPKRAKASAAAGVSAAHTVVAADSESDSDEADHAATLSEDEEETHLPAAVIQAIKSRAGRHIKAKNWFG